MYYLLDVPVSVQLVSTLGVEYCSKSTFRFCVLKSDFHQLEHAMTRSIIVFRDADGNIVMILYIGHDGYESGYGTMLARA